MILGIEQQIEIGGKYYTMSRLEHDILLEMFVFSKKYLPNPLKEAAAIAKDLPIELAKELLFKALDDMKQVSSITSPIFLDWLFKTAEGAAVLFYYMLRKNHPTLTLNDAFDLLEEYASSFKDSEEYAKAIAQLIETSNGKNDKKKV